MTHTSYVIKNILRNRRRAVLSILSVAVSLFLFVTLQITQRELTIPPEDIGSSLRIAVRNKLSLTHNLPARQRRLIQEIEGVELVSPLTFFGGLYGSEDRMSFAQFALDPELLEGIFGEAVIPPDQLEAFKKDRRGCIVGVDTADRYGFKIGDRVVIRGAIYDVNLELTVRGIYSGTIDDRNMHFHHRYLDELMNDWGQVGTWWVKADSAERVPVIIDQINRMFASTSHAVRAETERAFQMSFISMLGNVAVLIGGISSVVVLTLAIVSANTMSMAIRERVKEISILKALGFSVKELSIYILAESFLLSLLGALVGIGGAWILYTQVQVSRFTQGLLPAFEMTHQITALGFLIACVLGLISALMPMLSVLRSSVVGGLKAVE